MNQLNGHSNGKAKNTITADSQMLTNAAKAPAQPLVNSSYTDFEQSVILRQSPLLSRAIMLTLIGLACFGIVWAYFAKIEQVVPATGQLKPEGTVKEVQAPVSGVVKSVHVKDGEKVQPGDLLVTFETLATVAELDALKQNRNALIAENQIYRRLMGISQTTAPQVDISQAKLSAEAEFLVKNRTALVKENELLRAELNNSNTVRGLGIDEQKRLQFAQKELDSRSAAAKLEVEKTKKQLAQIQVRKSNTKSSLANQQGILDKIKTLADEGGISQIQYLNQQQQVQTLTADIAQLEEEEQRLKLAIQQGEQEHKNTVAASGKNILEKIADNKTRIADIDSQFMRIILNNEQRIADLNNRISQAQLNFEYQEVRAPVAGTVFDLQAKNPGFVANASQKLLQIVPDDKFIAEVFITNRDIGFVREGMRTDVRIDSFPFSQFGDIKGQLVSIGSDALPPDETYRFYRFPASISLDKQYLDINGRKISLQSGMSIVANIKVREERTVMSLFTEMFTKQIDSLKEVR
jgi:hemolysin D